MSERAGERTGERTSEPANERASEPANERTGERANERTGERANERTILSTWGRRKYPGVKTSVPTYIYRRLRPLHSFGILCLRLYSSIQPYLPGAFALHLCYHRRGATGPNNCGVLYLEMYIWIRR